MYGYIYKTTNLINNKIYVGQHISPSFDPKYLGSGIKVKAAFKKYGKSKFKCEVLEECQSLDELNQREAYWIDYWKSCNPHVGYNIKPGGNNAPWSEDVKRRIGEGNRGKKRSQEYIEAMRQRQLGNHYNGGCNKGRITLHKDGTQVFIMPDQVEYYLEEGYELGPTPPTQEKLQYYRSIYKDRVYIHKDGKNKYVHPEVLEDYLKDGWELGRVGYTAERAARIKQSKSGTIAIYKDNIKKYIRPEDLPSYIDQGFSTKFPRN